MGKSFNSELIAPCGMNCNICSAHLREKKQCPGCRNYDKDKSGYCRNCIITKCDKLKDGFCDCKKPCARLKNLDKRYRKKYDMSMLDNLAFIEEHGMQAFLEREEKRWTCSCGGIINVHKKICSSCGKVIK